MPHMCRNTHGQSQKQSSHVTVPHQNCGTLHSEKPRLFWAGVCMVYGGVNVYIQKDAQIHLAVF